MIPISLIHGGAEKTQAGTLYLNSTTLIYLLSTSLWTKCVSTDVDRTFRTNCSHRQSLMWFMHRDGI